MRALRILVASWLIVLGGSTCALAHGDPSSHYLESEPLYPAFADRPSPAVELQLLGLLQAAAKRGYPIKVALVASKDDLADDPSMLRRPQAYAQYVDFAVEGTDPVLVVTPYGFGTSGAPRLTLPKPGPHGDGLARSAMTAVRRLAKATGHPLPAHVPPAPTIASRAASTGGGVGGWVPGLAAALVFLLGWFAYERSGRSG